MVKIVGKKKSWFYYFIKRLFDIISSLLLFLIISWFFLIILIINCFSTKGAPIYIDKRVGKNGKELNLLKFRSMYKDAQEHPEKYFSDAQMEQWKKERKVINDPRVTKFGRFLRKTSIDELPQLINIFVGSMSVVGPRPIVRKELDDNYTKEQIDLLLSARPGLVSYWAINGRNLIGYNTGERQKLELEYFEKRSLLFELKMIFQAMFITFKKKGAQ